jgi:glycosyltransferase involved in cell wall biosynthesis
MESGVDSRVLLGAEEDQSESERHISRPFLWKAVDKPVRMLVASMGLHGVARPSFRLWRRAIDRFGPDVVHLHWTYSADCIPLLSLGSLAASYPVVWTFHDMWPFTGGCTNSKGCERWLTGCGLCPILAAGEKTGAMLAMPRDRTALHWKVKHRALSRASFTVVAPSEWMAELAARSPIAGRCEVVCVPNALDTAYFHPRSKTEARLSLGLPVDGIVLLFIGKPHDVFFYEGRVPLLLDALRILANSSPTLAKRTSLLVIGGRGEEILRASGHAGIALGSVAEEDRLVECLSAADAMVNTTQYDNLPGVVQEAMSCALPVVASDVGGLAEMLDHGRAGLLADHSSPTAFAECLERVLADEALRMELGRRARDRATRTYDVTAVIPTMLSIYERALRRAS